MTDQPEAVTEEKLKYPKPSILLMDVGSEVESVLKEAGYNISVGSFGTPYKVTKSDNFQPVIPNGKLPDHYAEKEIVIIDLGPASVSPVPNGEKVTTPREKDWWASCSRGFIDPRPRYMARFQDDFDRILSYGGVFIIFASPRESQGLVLAHQNYAEQLIQDESIDFDNWSFLSYLSRENLIIKPDHGREMQLPEAEDHLLSRFLAKYLRSANYSCTLDPDWFLIPFWTTLLQTKYGNAVAGIIAGEGEGLVLLLPRIQDRPGFLIQLLDEVLPELHPHLFPHTEGTRWAHRSEYEHPEVLGMRSEIQRIQQETKQRVDDLEAQIEEKQRSQSYLYDLLTQTGERLVDAVEQTLKVLGFQDVINMDQEMAKQGDTGPKREDLRINDISPLMLVEVKGITNLPKESEALQVATYLAPRMRTLTRTDIQGLSIINHQKHLPALNRNNNAPFSDDTIISAQQHGVGLLTTWDLFRLTRGYLKNKWQHEYVKDLFYQDGRIEPVPRHYELIGTIEDFWATPSAVAICLETGTLRLGDRVAFELSVEFEEQEVKSLQVNRKDVQCVEAGNTVGLKTNLTKEQAKKGTRVFRVVELISS